MFHFKLHSASNLPKADTIGSIDGYALVKIPISGGLYTEFKTSVVKNSYDPKWKFTCPIVHNPDTSRDVIVVIMDHDKVGQNDFVCHCRISFVNLLTPCRKNTWKLECEKGFSPQRKGEDCLIKFSSCLSPSFEQLVESVKSKNEETIVDSAKKQILVKIPSTGYYLRAKYGKNLSLSIYDTMQERAGLAEFVIPEHNSIVKNHFSSLPDTLNGLKVYRQIKLKKQLIPSDISNIQIGISQLSTVLETKEGDVTRNHGWTGSFSYQEAKKVLKNVICDDGPQTIYMIEDYFFIKCDWDSSNGDEVIGLLDPFKSQGYHLENKYSSKREFYVKTFAKPKNVLGTGKTYSLTSEVKDLEYPYSLSDITITLSKKQDTQYYPLSKFLSH